MFLFGLFTMFKSFFFSFSPSCRSTKWKIGVATKEKQNAKKNTHTKHKQNPLHSCFVDLFSISYTHNLDTMSEETKPVEVPKEEISKEETTKETVEKPVENSTTESTTTGESNSKRQAEGGEAKKEKKRRRRQYDDVPDEPEEEDEDEDDEDDEKLDAKLEEEGDEEEDDLAEIDTSNIITTGRRTRGKVIDYAKTAAQLDNEAGKATGAKEDEDDDDADFKEPSK